MAIALTSTLINFPQLLLPFKHYLESNHIIQSYLTGHICVVNPPLFFCTIEMARLYV